MSRSRPFEYEEPHEEKFQSSFSFRSHLDKRKYSDVCKGLMCSNDLASDVPEDLLVDIRDDSVVSVEQEFESFAVAMASPTHTSTSATSTGASPAQSPGKWQQHAGRRKSNAANRRRNLALQSQQKTTNANMKPEEERNFRLPAIPRPAAVPTQAKKIQPVKPEFSNNGTRSPHSNKFEPLSDYEFAECEPAALHPTSRGEVPEGPEIETAPPSLPEEPNGRPSALSRARERQSKQKSQWPIRTVFILKDSIQVPEADMDNAGSGGGGEEWVVVALGDEVGDYGAGYSPASLHESWLDAGEEVEKSASG